MLLFLGDSCPLGWELELELSEMMPQDYDVSSVYFRGFELPAEPKFRPDLAYPQIVATILDQPFWNLGMGGSSYDQILFDFQKFLKEHEMPKDTTLFLSLVSFFRRTLIDGLTSQIYKFFPEPMGELIPQMCYDSEELLMRTAPAHAVQQINHIYEICKSRNWNFVFHGVGCDMCDEELGAINLLCEIPEEHRLSELWKEPWHHTRPDLWFGCHPSVKGHEKIANELIAHYNERLI